MTGTEFLYHIYIKHPIICTDTRNIVAGCLFFALKGENFDANTFADKALASGAAYVVIDNEAYKTGDRHLIVSDVLQALQGLAKHHRTQLNIPVIGLTGSNGKTTTKELINAVLSEKYKSFATKGNLNNHIGVPLSILSITSETEIAVIEMGANHQREIEFLCDLAMPTHGLITNVGMAHLDGFGGFEGVKKGKAELYAYLKANQGTAFIYRNNPYLLEMSQAAGLDTILYYSTFTEDYISGNLINADPHVQLSWSQGGKDYQVSVNLTGTYNFENILAAICIGTFFNVSPKQINAGLSGYLPKNNRSQITKTVTNTVICDFYNANPSSMSAALSNINQLVAQKKTIVIGDMFELGTEAEEQHRLIAKQAEATNADLIIFVGKYFYGIKDELQGLFFETPAEASKYLSENPVRGSLVLLKGSRGMALEQLLPLF
ncbi:MAG: UDP-N-acetylmuramoyl-tripeptide--D-alanyl-D-alanine ligase [Bacteroidota bacterium]